MKIGGAELAFRVALQCIVLVEGKDQRAKKKRKQKWTVRVIIQTVLKGPNG